MADPQTQAVLDPEWVAKQVLEAHGGQVAGHPGTLQSLRGPNGEHLIVKESLDSEVRFYRELNDAAAGGNDSAKNELLAKWTPKYFGTLPAVPPSKKPHVILEDLLSGYKRPNVLDIKLGTQLWDDGATEEKRERMDKASRETTSFETGIRLTGWRNWEEDQQRFISIGKSFGKSIKASDLHLGLKAFFGLLEKHSADGRAYGELCRSTEAASPSDSTCIETSEDFRENMIRALTTSLLPSFQRLQELFQQLQVRIRGGSVLVVYEGDQGAWYGKTDQNPFSVHVIDFAHATFVPGQGPDQGILLGLRSVAALLQEIIDATARV